VETLDLKKYLKTYKGISGGVSPKICLLSILDCRVPVNIMKKSDFERVDFFIRAYVVVGKALIYITESNIFRNMLIKNFVGKRHYLGLPTRGQRTRSNGRTSKRLILAPFKKDVLNQKKMPKKKQ
jgi:ribosomal protein S13